MEPLAATSADELFSVLDDPDLHAYTGGEPLSREALTARFARLAARRSQDGHQEWGNWLLRERATGQAVGTVQATLPARGPTGGFAEVAWVVGSAWQGRGLGTEAARSLVGRLRDAGWTVVAHVHPDHRASQGVARAAGLRPTDVVQDGEVRWLVAPRTGPAAEASVRPEG